MKMSEYYRGRMEEELELARRYERCPEDQQKAAGAKDARRAAEYYRNLMEQELAEEAAEETETVEETETAPAKRNVYGMENVRITSQRRYCYVGNRKVEFFDVIADTKRFGKQAIMCQGPWQQCLDYLEENGIDYVGECLKRNRQQDIQVGVRMYRIEGETDAHFLLKSRDYYEAKLRKDGWRPIAPDSFRIPAEAITWRHSNTPFDSGYSKKDYTIRLMNARAW